ncbi:MAG: alpha/beta hydrolase [Deltaproteobacteria bacterium]|nr:alpha/beta hydrolase [Deltaproteobacteria bacterium]
MPLDPEAKAMLDAMSAAPAVDLFSVPHTVIREAFGSMPGGPGPVLEMAKVEARDVDGPQGKVPIRIYTPAGGAERKPGIVFFHGGGFVLCSLDTHDATCRQLAKGTDSVVVSVDYRLAPEAKFPAAPEDCYAATQWTALNARELGIDVGRIAVAGDSAGGNLAAVVSLMCRDRGGHLPIHQLLIYPVTDASLETESYRVNGEGYFLSKDMMRWFWHHYLESDADAANPLASPLRAASLAGLPPATVVTAEYDPLRDEGREYAKRLAAAGVPTQYTNYDGVFHGFFAMTEQLPRARQAVDDACAALRKAFGA